ncbi:MAG: domain S-box-containing protein [Frankiales bacterium]|nr:domain S-box-containing protein [Frankiales bacterium]
MLRSYQARAELAEALIASAPVAAGFIDTDFRLLRVNDTLATLNGISVEHDLGRTVEEVLPELWPVFEPRYRAVLECGELVTAVETVNGSTWFAKYFPVHVKGEFAGIGIIGIDITKTKDAERLRSVVLDTMAEGVFALDRHGQIVLANRSAGLLLGWPAEELQGRPAHETLHYLHADGTSFDVTECPLVRVQADGRTLRITDDAFVRRDGTLLPVAYSASPLRDDRGQVDGVVVAFRDAADDNERRQAAQRELDALHWLGRLRDALDEDRLELYSQPIVPLRGGDPSEELLLRLITPRGDVVAPGVFLPVAERYGLIADVDRWAVRRAIEVAAHGRRVEVNVSAWTIANVDLLPVIEDALRVNGTSPSSVVFEITETALMQDLEAGKAFAKGVTDLGCGLALDDFGTGFASFTYLKSLPFTHLKIDIDFVRDLPNNPANRHVVDAIVSLAKGFGQVTVAEGVEDQATLGILKDCGVDYAQGYHLGRPAPRL